MSTFDGQDPVAVFTRTSQIIVSSLITGVLVFLGIASFVGPVLPAPAAAGGVAIQGNAAGAKTNPDAGADQLPLGTILTYTAIAFAAVALPLSFVVPAAVTNQNRRRIAAGTWTPPAQGGAQSPPVRPEAFQTDADKLAMIYQMQLIIGAALIEGVAFFAGVAYFLSKNPIALGLALLLVGALFLRFPTIGSVQRWIDQQQEKLILDRQSAT
jgi:hypothetical protein